MGAKQDPVVTFSARERKMSRYLPLAVGLVALAIRALHPLWPILPFPSVLSLSAAVVLGGCLWWVVKRQFGHEAAAWTLFLYAAVIPLAHLWSVLAAMALFPFLYSAVGLAHATQGPARKWPPRIALGAALAALLGAAGFSAVTVAGFALAVAGVAYLAWPRLRDQGLVLAGILLGWAVIAYGASRLGLQGWLSLLPGTGSDAPLSLASSIVPAVAFLAALVGWCASRRSRWFGNTAPLLATVVFVGVGFVPGGTEWMPVVALPFVLLFAAGVLADALEGPQRWLWRVVSGALVIGGWVVSLVWGGGS